MKGNERMCVAVKGLQGLRLEEIVMARDLNDMNACDNFM